MSPAKQYAAWLAAAKKADKAAAKAGKVEAVKGGYGKIGDGTLIRWMVDNKALILQLIAMFVVKQPAA